VCVSVNEVCKLLHHCYDPTYVYHMYSTFQTIPAVQKCARTRVGYQQKQLH